MKIDFKEEMAYHAKTQEEADFILDEAHSQGYEWIDGDSCKENKNWSYKEKTVYFIKEGVSFGNVSNYSDIIEIETLIPKYNSLPLDWAVMGDKSQRFMDVVVTYNHRYGKQNWRGNGAHYYGYKGSDRNVGTEGWWNGSLCPGSTILTIDEFIECTKEKQLIQTIKQSKTEKNENNQQGIKVCRPVTTVTRGQEIRGNSISGRTSKIKLTIGHLSNKEIFS